VTMDRACSFSFLVSEKDHGKRLDQFLAAGVPGSTMGLSRSQAKKLIEEGRVLIDGKPGRPSLHVKAGNQLSATLPGPRHLSIEPEPVPLSVLYEDASIIVIDKPPGLVVHPAPGNPAGTLVNALIHHCRNLAGIDPLSDGQISEGQVSGWPLSEGQKSGDRSEEGLRPGIVHRLDKETSGVMVVAKDEGAYQALTKQFKNRTIDKVYLAIARGRFTQEEGVIDLAIGRHPTERKRMSTRSPRMRRAKAALTRWRVLERLNGVTLLEISPKTGRTHQIRVHLSAMGHPLLGDPLYGRGRALQDHTLKECSRRLGRQALHAHRLDLTHPATGKRLQFISPLPADMREVLDWLRSEKKTSDTRLQTSD